MPPRPQSIPSLLSSLPNSSACATFSARAHPPIFIRPSTAPSTSFFAITRSKLKFSPADEVKRVSTARHPSKIVGEAKAANLPKSALAPPVPDGRVGSGSIEDRGGRVRVSGRAWGREYANGKLVLASSPLAKPDSRFHGAAEKKWVLVDASEIPQGVIEELNQAVAAARASS